MESLRRSTLQGQHGDWHFELAQNSALPRLSAATPAAYALETTRTERKRETPTNLIRSIAGLHSYARKVARDGFSRKKCLPSGSLSCPRNRPFSCFSTRPSAHAERPAKRGVLMPCGTGPLVYHLTIISCSARRRAISVKTLSSCRYMRVCVGAEFSSRPQSDGFVTQLPIAFTLRWRGGPRL